MIKRSFVLLLALCLCLTAACGAEDLLQDITQSLKNESTAMDAPEQPAAESSGTDAAVPEDGAEQSAQTDWTALTAEQCVQDAWPEPGVVPRITLDCPGAETINAQLEHFLQVADDPMCEQLFYQCAKGAQGRVLSILMEEHGPNDTVFYTIFNLDVATGQALSGAELLSLLGVDTAELANLEQAVMGKEFVHQFGTAEQQADPAFYERQYALTTAPENADTDRVWLAGDGQLDFIGRIYPLAGAEYYEYILGSTLYFG